MHASHPGASRTAQTIIAVPLRKATAGRRSDDSQAHENARPAASLTTSSQFAAAKNVPLALPASRSFTKNHAARGCVPLLPGTRTSTAYFLGVISAGRYREISKPAATWHMVGFVQLFFITFLLFYQPEGADPVVSQPLQRTEAMARPSRLKWTNETQGFERPKTKLSKVA
ncbi:hypothetical protein NKH80_07930 [Mesorhizobium sp. M0904]|uniref:hypothetical protein n=1 Tax=Mesorhizobium sp. M0904 TaxID=2957022 RepID=UPI00333B0CBD